MSNGAESDNNDQAELRAGQGPNSSLGASGPHLQPSDIAQDELHKIAFATLDIGVWKYDLLRKKMSWGTEVEAILGVRPSSSPEETFFGLMHADDQPQMMAEFQNSLATGQAFHLDFRIQRVDGSMRWMTSTGQPYFDAEGRPTHVIGTVLDCTEKKLAEQWLHAQNDVLRLIAVGLPAHEVYQAIVEMMHKGLDVSMAALLQLDGNRRLRLLAGANVPQDYISAIQAIHVGDENCLCAYTVLAAEPLFSEKLLTDPRCNALRPMIESHNWGSCCTFPIVNSPVHPHTSASESPSTDESDVAKVAGLFALYRTQSGRPDEKELRKISQAVHLANIVIARDRAHHSLQESERRFRDLANAMPQLVWTQSTDGTCTYGNRLLKETIGEEALNDWISVVHPDDRELVVSRFAEAIRTGQPYTAEHRLLVRNSGTYRWFLARALPSRDADGNVNLWYGAATDIDELKRIESDLRQERDRLAAIASACPSVLFTYMELPDGTPTVPYAAPSVRELVGASPHEIRHDAKSVVERVNADDMRRIRGLLNDAIDKMSSIEAAFRLEHPDKGIVWVECHAAPCRLADGNVCWHGTLTDITRRKMLETRLLQSEKLEAIGRLAGGIAHDFNNMLTVIISACHVLETCLSNQPADLENVDAIRQAAMRAAALTKQLLAFSRQQPSQPQQLNLNAVVTQNEVILQRIIGPDISLQSEMADDLKLVSIDPSQMEQILVNLIINSRDAIADKGTIKIVTRNVLRCGPQESVNGASFRDYVEICVSDTGCGMTNETMSRIFDPFFTTKPIGKGTGLGLAVVHGVVTQNSGLIEVESQVDKGTSFRILLPALDQSGTTFTHERTGGPLEGGSEGVLVVDDEPSIGTMTSKTLRSLGYTVYTASSPEEAIQVFQTHWPSIDILLTDLLMPGCTGVNLAGQLVAKKPDLRVVVMSGHRTSSFDHADVTKTGYRFLPKPFTTLELSSVLRSAIDG